MAKSRTELMADRLRDLQAATPEIEASAVVSVDGLTIASSMPVSIEEDRVSAMSAAMLSLGERMMSRETALDIVKMWLETPFEGGRHVRRIQLLDQP